MHKFAAFFLMPVLLLAAPASAAVIDGCPMMGAPVGHQLAFSAQPHSCCPQGACDCSMTAQTPYPAAVAGTGLERHHEAGLPLSLPAILSTSPKTADNDSDASESPPGPDKPYKLTSQYRI